MDAMGKAKLTRQRNQEAQTTLYQEKAAANQAARLALQRVFENEESSPAEILEAARLLAELGRY